MLSMRDLIRLDVGHFTAPPGHPLAPRVVVVQAFLVRHPAGLLLFDTGIGQDPETDGHYRIMHRRLPDALAAIGVRIADVRIVVNCHLHFDHAGENFHFAGVPIFAQRAEIEAAGGVDYTLAPLVIDFRGAHFETIDGEAEPWAGLRIIPTPGHSPGHQSLLVETREGRILLAGQAFDMASEYASAEVARRVAEDGEQDVPVHPEWMRRISELDPRRVLFAHDLAVYDAQPLNA